MTNQVDQLRQRLRNLYDHNPYVALLEMQIIDLQDGRAELAMPVRSDKHTNLYQAAHGGAMASLADIVMGVACATRGIRVVTLEMNINFFRSAETQGGYQGRGKGYSSGTQYHGGGSGNM